MLFEDTAAVLGLLLAGLGTFLSVTLNNPIYDSLASIAIGVILAVVAVLLAYESRALLIGESADPQILRDVNHLLKEDEKVLQHNFPLTMHMSPNEIVLALEVNFDPRLSAEQIEKNIDRIEKSIKQMHPEVKRIFIEAESITKSKLSTT